MEFLVDSELSVTAMSTLRGANGTGIGVSGCSHCVVSFMGLQTEFPILICDLATGTDAIIGTDVLGTVLPHTLDIKNGLLFTEGGASLQLHRRDSALSGRVEECVTEMLTGGQIEPSDSSWSSPVVLVTKKDGGTRFCVDYCRLNDVTVKDAYPLPRIDDTLDMLTGKQWFSTLDLASGYWQVSLSQEARVKTAFVTHSGLFQFRVMPFGLCNAPATLERLMDRVLQVLRWSHCLVYLDDIISFGSTVDSALANLTLIFERLRSYALQLKSTKCHLFRSSVPFLGHIVGRRGLECDPSKIEDVKSWPVPDCLKSVRQFLGFVGYYRRFILNFADVATPLETLTGKDVPFVWDAGCSNAFSVPWAALIHAPILAFPTETGQYILDTDASNVGLGGVLSQIQDERVVAYCSRALRPSQRRYCTTKREMLAAVAMCIQFWSYLRDAKFILRTDHKSLVWLHRIKDTEGMMARWLHALHNFSSLSYTGRAGTMVMRTASREFQRRRADNLQCIVHRLSRLLSSLINLLILSRRQLRGY